MKVGLWNTPPFRYLVESPIGLDPWDQCCPSSGHAGPRVCWLGPELQGSPNYNFLPPKGRRGTIWDFKTGVRHRIPAQISPWGSRGLNPKFFRLDSSSNPKFFPKFFRGIFWQGFRFITHRARFGMGPLDPAQLYRQARIQIRAHEESQP